MDPVHIFGFDFSKSHEIFGLKFTPVFMYYYLLVFLVIAIVFICLRLQNSRIGRAFVAIREDEIAAKAMGINTRNIKLLAFAMGASFGGASGAVFGAFQALFRLSRSCCGSPSMCWPSWCWAAWDTSLA